MQIRALLTGISLSLCLIASILVQVAPIGSSTEAREAHLVRVLSSGGDWILPLRNGIIPSKPPLYHWVGAGFSYLLGQSEGAARMPSVLFGVGTLILTMLLGLELRQFREKKDQALQALFTALVLCSSWGFLGLMLEARVDMTFAFFTTLASYLLLRRFKVGFLADGVGISPFSGSDFFWFYIASALAVLARGPIGLALPLLVTFAAQSYMGGFRTALKCFAKPRLGWLAFSLIVFPWYILAALRGSDSFIWRQVVFENLLRLSGGAHVNTEAPWFYLPSFLRTAFPWSFIFLWTAVISDSSKTRPRLDDAERVKRILSVWILVALLFFSLASGKRHSYLLPLFPALAIHVGWTLTDWAASRTESMRAWLDTYFSSARWEYLLVFLLVLLECVRLPVLTEEVQFLQSLLWLRSVLPMLELSVLLALLISLIANANLSHGQFRGFGNWLSVTTCLLVCATVGMGVKNALKGYVHFATNLSAVAPISKIEILKDRFDESFDALMYYAAVPIKVTDPSFERVTCLSGDCLPFKLMKQEFYDQWLLANHGANHNVQVLQTFSASAARFKNPDQKEFVLLSIMNR